MNPYATSDGIGELRQQIFQLLESAGHPRIATHCMEVAEEAGGLARRFGEAPDKAAVAALLHDIGAVIPGSERIEFLAQRGIDCLPEERVFPMILHQRVSAVLAGERFHIQDTEILSAIGCHTTLKPEASRLDMVVYIADKIRWDQSGRPPYLDDVLTGLRTSLERGSLAYVSYLVKQKEQLKVLHPLTAGAYRHLMDLMEQEKISIYKELL